MMIRSSPPSTDDAGGATQAASETSLRRRVMSLQMPRDIQVKRGIAWGRWAAAAAAVAVLGIWLATYFDGDIAARLRSLTSSTAAPANNPPPAPSTTSPSNTASAAAAQPAGEAGTGKIVLESKGYLTPAHQILVSPKVTGMVVHLDIEEGRAVKKGDVLALLEAVEYERDLERAVATRDLAKAQLLELENGSRPEEIKQGEAELAQAQEEIIDLERIYKRQRMLYESKSTPEQEFQRTESAYLAMLRRLERLKLAVELLKQGPRVERIAAGRAAVAQAEAEVGKAQWRLDNCKIVAPITGTILKKNAEEGNIVNPMAFNGSFSLCELADLSDLEVDLSIQERDIARIFVGQKCRIRTEAYPDRFYDGEVSRLMPIADRSKGAVPVRVKVRVAKEEQGLYLKPQMGAIVSFFDVKVTRAPAAAPTTTSTPTAAPAGSATAPVR